MPAVVNQHGYGGPHVTRMPSNRLFNGIELKVWPFLGSCHRFSLAVSGLDRFIRSRHGSRPTLTARSGIKGTFEWWQSPLIPSTVHFGSSDWGWRSAIDWLVCHGQSGNAISLHEDQPTSIQR
ncbi:hypothetical protein BN77_p11596 [Rhizobium mesoamericanum STM3625]|uniref:Uncharacterized protein n=1 Tax=Rhizobium mesoamericanum STM3625 TaxID=1211777 RepID=K0Q2R3_9HYPH|nr:hypothetical protein BN77_p11596 [Rhizobium mesoamericanum STM3625]